MKLFQLSLLGLTILRFTSITQLEKTQYLLDIVIAECNLITQNTNEFSKLDNAIKQCIIEHLLETLNYKHLSEEQTRILQCTMHNSIGFTKQLDC